MIRGSKVSSSNYRNYHFASSSMFSTSVYSTVTNHWLCQVYNNNNVRLLKEEQVLKDASPHHQIAAEVWIKELS